MKNAFSVDVEDYFQVSGFESTVSRDDWDHFPSRVVDNTLRLLDLLAAAECARHLFRTRLGGPQVSAAGP